MKIYKYINCKLIKTGEVRRPSQGEYYLNPYDRVYDRVLKAHGNPEDYDTEYPILKPVQEEEEVIPEWLTIALDKLRVQAAINQLEKEIQKFSNFKKESLLGYGYLMALKRALNIVKATLKE